MVGKQKKEAGYDPWNKRGKLGVPHLSGFYCVDMGGKNSNIKEQNYLAEEKRCEFKTDYWWEIKWNEMKHIWKTPNSAYQLFLNLWLILKLDIYEKGTKKLPKSPAETSSWGLKNWVV